MHCFFMYCYDSSLMNSIISKQNCLFPKAESALKVNGECSQCFSINFPVAFTVIYAYNELV